SRYPGEKEKALWVVAEKVGMEFRWATMENLGKARELAEELKSEVVAVLMEEASQQDVENLASYGADSILALEGRDYLHPISPLVAEALADAVKEQNPYAVLVPSTANGRDLASRVAARLSLGLTGDCIDLELDDEGRLVQLKPALGGNVVAPILSKTRPYMATIRPGLLSPIEPQPGSSATVEHFSLASTKEDPIKVLESHREEDARGAELERASVVLAVGKGIGGPEHLPTIYKLAERLGATVAATRNVTDAGWLPKQLQVGLTGRAIAPELYIAVGVRGAFNHMVGIQKAGTIVAINSNPRHPIFQGADFGIVGDWQTYLPPLVDALVEDKILG
ncbi:MAG: electron transfer flavoprotein subunit alpha/FixB family protein, partial [Dehalococcoidia bacterium]